MDGDIFQSFRGAQESFHPDSHVPGIRVNGACGHHGGLLFDDTVNIRRRQAEGSQLVLVHSHVNHLFLHAQELHLLHVRHQYQTAADIFRIFTFFFVTVIVAGQGINGSVHIIETVVDDRSLHTGGHIAPYIGDRIPHVMPPLLDFRLRHAVLQVHVNDGLPVVGKGLDIVQPLRILQLPLQGIGDLVRDLLRRSAGPGSGDDHFTDGKIRVLAAAQAEVREDPADNDGNDEEIDDLLVANRPFRQVHPFHVLTSSPSVSLEAPAETMRSPLSMPPVISTVSSP